MIANRQLHRIRTGEATAKEARAIIRDLVATLEPSNHEALYAALRGWTWKAMQTRRFDDELSDWFQVLNGASAALSRSDTKVSHFLLVLSHLVDDSLRYAATHHTEQLLNRSHIGEILEIVARHNGRIDRDRLKETIGLADSRLSQVLRDLTIAGALERLKDSRQASFVLTDTGRELLESWSALRRAPQDDEELEEAAEEREEWRPRGEILRPAAPDNAEVSWKSVKTHFGHFIGKRRELRTEARVAMNRILFEPEAPDDVWSDYQRTETKCEELVDV